MSMDLGGAKGGVKSDINVTPLVDVMLVLLIIMMLVAPMLEQGVQVKLPNGSERDAEAAVAGSDDHRDRRQPVVVRQREAGAGSGARDEGHRSCSRARPAARRS